MTIELSRLLSSVDVTLGQSLKGSKQIRVGQQVCVASSSTSISLAKMKKLLSLD